MDLETDKTGVMARDLLKHDVQEMYEVLDEYNKLGFGDPMTNKMRESINALVTEMRVTISSKKGVKRPFWEMCIISVSNVPWEMCIISQMKSLETKTAEEVIIRRTARPDVK